MTVTTSISNSDHALKNRFQVLQKLHTDIEDLRDNSTNAECSQIMSYMMTQNFWLVIMVMASVRNKNFMASLANTWQILRIEYFI